MNWVVSSGIDQMGAPVARRYGIRRVGIAPFESSISIVLPTGCGEDIRLVWLALGGGCLDFATHNLSLNKGITPAPLDLLCSDVRILATTPYLLVGITFGCNQPVITAFEGPNTLLLQVRLGPALLRTHIRDAVNRRVLPCAMHDFSARAVLSCQRSNGSKEFSLANP